MAISQCSSFPKVGVSVNLIVCGSVIVIAPLDAVLKDTTEVPVDSISVSAFIGSLAVYIVLSASVKDVLFE